MASQQVTTSGINEMLEDFKSKPKTIMFKNGATVIGSSSCSGLFSVSGTTMGLGSNEISYTNASDFTVTDFVITDGIGSGDNILGYGNIPSEDQDFPYGGTLYITEMDWTITDESPTIT